MTKMLFISTDNVIEEVDLTDDQIKEKIGGFMEIVHPRGLPGYILVVDEEGLLKERPINVPGSLWYGFLYHGQPIVGDILVANSTDEGNFFDLTEEDIADIRKEIPPFY